MIKQRRARTLPSSVYIAAESISCGVMIPETEPSNHKPVITMDFPIDFATALTEQLLRPHVHSEHCFVAINPSGSMFEIAMYFIVRVPEMIELPALAGMRAITAGALKEPYVYVIGNEGDVAPETLAPFIAGKSTRGHFFVGCGGISRVSPGIDLTGDWSLRVETIYGQDIRAQIERAKARALAVE